MILKTYLTFFRFSVNGYKLVHYEGLLANKKDDHDKVNGNHSKELPDYSNTTFQSMCDDPNHLNRDNLSEPTTCCMSGCANCVWLDYAEALCKYYRDGGEKAIKEINQRISDPNIKAYILHEIRVRNK